MFFFFALGPINDLLAKEDRKDRKNLLSVASRNIDRLGRLVDMLCVPPSFFSPYRPLLVLSNNNKERLPTCVIWGFFFLLSLRMDVSRVEAGRMNGTFSPRNLGMDTANLASLFRFVFSFQLRLVLSSLMFFFYYEGSTRSLVC